MPLRTSQIMKNRRLANTKIDEQQIKRKVNVVGKELLATLEAYLADHDAVMLEVSGEVLAIFQDTVDSIIGENYTYEQVAENLFVFHNKEIAI